MSGTRVAFLEADRASATFRNDASSKETFIALRAVGRLRSDEKNGFRFSEGQSRVGEVSE